MTTCLFNLLKPAYWCITCHLIFPDALANFIDCRCQDVVLDSFRCVRCATQSQALWKGVKRSFQYNLHWPHGTYGDKVGEEWGRRSTERGSLSSVPAIYAQCTEWHSTRMSMTTGGAGVGVWEQNSTGWQSPGKLQLHFNAITMATAQSARRCPSPCLCSRRLPFGLWRMALDLTPPKAHLTLTINSVCKCTVRNPGWYVRWYWNILTIYKGMWMICVNVLIGVSRGILEDIKLFKKGYQIVSET